MLEDFKDEINKCSKCGLCQSVCPVYKITGNDCAVSRGKFVMLDGVLKGDLKLNKNINKYLDLCLKCGKCTDFCPSAIDVCKIFEAAKYEYASKTFLGKCIFILESKYVFGAFLKFCKFIWKAGRFHENLTSPPEGEVCFQRESDNSKVRKQGEGWIKSIMLGKYAQPTETAACSATKIKLLYFKGCVNNIFPKTEKSVKKILSHTNVEIIERDFDCCGLPFLSSGNLKRYEEVKKHNLELMDCDFDYILTDCASCESTLKQYAKGHVDDLSEKDNCHCKVSAEASQPIEDDNIALGRYAQPTETQNDGCLNKANPSPEFISFGELIAGLELKFNFPKPVKVTFHKPCHLKDDNFIETILNNCTNVEYVKMDNYDDCCGFAGEFAIKNLKISQEISKQKARNILKTAADYVITTCPACVLGLKQGFLFLGEKAPKIMNIADFLALAKISLN